jgi:hypothetical protein
MPFNINLCNPRNCAENEHFQRLISTKLLRIINLLPAVNNQEFRCPGAGLNNDGDLIGQRSKSRFQSRCEVATINKHDVTN